MSNKNQIHKILNEDTTQSYNKANSKLLNIIKNQVAYDSKSTNLFSQLYQKQNNEMLNADLNMVNKKRTQLAIKGAELNPDGAITPAIPQIPQQVATNFTIASQKAINIMNHISGILRSLDFPPPISFNVNRDIKWSDLFDAFTQLQQQTMYLLQGQGQYKSNQVVQQIDLVSSKSIEFSEVVGQYQDLYIDGNNRARAPQYLQFIIDDSIWQRLDIIEEFLLNAQNQLQIFREGLSPGGAFDDNTRGPIPPVYNYPVYQQNLAVPPRIAPGIVALGGDDDDNSGLDAPYGYGGNSDSDSDFYSYHPPSDNDGDDIPPADYSDDYSDDYSSNFHSLSDSFASVPSTIDWGMTPGGVSATPLTHQSSRRRVRGTMPTTPEQLALIQEHRRNNPRSTTPRPPGRVGPFSPKPVDDRNDGSRRGLMLQLQEQNKLLDRGEITGMQQSENQSQHSYDSSGDIISGVASTSNITPRAIGPFTQSPSSRFSGPFNPSPPSGDYVSSQVRKIERANDSVRKEKLRFDREAVLELESQAPTSQAPTQPVFTSPRNSKKSVQIRDDMEDIQARERDQLDPRHRLFDDDEAEIIAGDKPTAGLTSSERNIERAVLFLENYLVDKDFQSIYEYLMNPNIPIDEVEKIANKLSNLYPQSYDEYVEYVSSTDRARQSAEKKATKGKHDIPSERKIHLSVETLLPQLRKKDYGSIYTYFRDADLTAHEVRKIANALNHIEPDLYSEYIDFMAENEIESPGSKQRTKAEAKSDESPDKKINDIVAVLLPVLKNDDFELLYTYLNSPNLTAEESQSIYKKLMSLDPVKFSLFILFAEDYEKQLEKKEGVNDIKIRTLKVDLTKWYNSSNFTAFNAWRDANIKSEAQESALLETLSASPSNSYKLNYGKMYIDLKHGKSKTFRAGTGTGKRK